MPTGGETYAGGFYDRQLVESTAAACRVVPTLSDLFPAVESVLDVGGGVGAWARAWSDAGRECIVVDGEWAAESVVVPHHHFVPHNLSEPLDMGRKFDLVMCLEVAEHLNPDAAETLIDIVAHHGDLVIFSAAIPGQGGQSHVNERWPSYWRELFRNRGFELFDVLRPRLWEDEAVGFWFRQNLLAYARGEAANQMRELPSVPYPVDIVHPQQFTLKLALAARRPPVRVAARWVAEGLRDRLEAELARRQPRKVAPSRRSGHG